MAGKKTLGAGLALDGEKEFKSAISNINKDLSVLGSEMTKVSAQFGANADSMEALTAKQNVYNKQIDEHKKKIEVLKEALAASAKEFGENDAKTKNWQISLNKAEADLAKTENSLKETSDKMEQYGKESEETGKDVEKAGKKAKASGDDAERGESGWSKFGSAMSKAGQFAGKAVAALGTVAVGAAAAVGGMTVKAAQSADEINTLAKQTGLSVEEIQKFQFASEQIDVSMDTLTGSMSKLTKNMASAKGGAGPVAEAFKTLEVSITDSSGQLRDNEDVFNDTIAALGKISNETERDALAMQIFGKSAQDLNPLILGGADDLKKLGDEAEAAGLILKQDALDNLNSFADSMDTFKATLSGSGSLFATAFAGPMSQGLNTVIGYMQDMTSAFSQGGFSALSDKVGEIITDIINKVNEFLPKVLEFGLSIVTKIVEGLTENLPALIEGATNILMMLVNTLLEMLPQFLEMGLQVIIQLAMGIAKALPELIPAIVDTVMMIVETLIDNIDLLIDAAIAIVMGLAEGLIEALPRLIDKVPIIIEKLINAIVENIPKLIEAGIQLIIALAGGLVKAIPQIYSKIPEVMKSIVNGLMSGISNIVEVGKNIVSGIWEGIKSMGKWIGDKVSGFFKGVVDGAKDFLGIHSPSTVFAGIGKNMALGLGAGFDDEMDDISSRINNSIPTGPSGSARGGIVVNVPVNLDGQILNTSSSRIQYGKNLSRARSLGVPA